jgi:hypothetical protein
MVAIIGGHSVERFGTFPGTPAVALRMKHPSCTFHNLCVINHRMNGEEHNGFTFFRKGCTPILRFPDKPI